MTLTQGQKQMLEKAYLTPSHAASFSSAQKLRLGLLSKKQTSKRGVQVRVPPLKLIQQWLQEKRPHTLHKPARKNYKMKKVIVAGVNIQLQMDLIDMQAWASGNDGFRYILLAIDCFSRFGYARPLKTKQGQLVNKNMESILVEAEKRIDRRIKYIQVDQGTEFYNKHVKGMLENRHVSLFSTKSPTKAQMVERLIRTLRSRQERYNTFRGKRRWVESFPLLVNSYNKTIHSSLPEKMTPADVNLKNERLVWRHLYADVLLKTPKSLEIKLKALKNGRPIFQKKESKRFNVGDPVRLSKRKQLFEKAYYQNYTDEIFFVAHVSKSTVPPTFRVADVEGELLEGIFYSQELTPVRFDEKDNKKHSVKGKIYAVESVLKEEVRKDGKNICW